MDNPNYLSLLALFNVAKRYMGKTWIASVEYNLTSLYQQLEATSVQNAANLALAVESENQLKAVRTELSDVIAARDTTVSPESLVVVTIPETTVEQIEKTEEAT